jgi:hypothetical protein
VRRRPEIVREDRVRWNLDSGRGCLTDVERGPPQAVCQAQILLCQDFDLVVWATEQARPTLQTS